MDEKEPEAVLVRKAVALGPQSAITMNVLHTRGSMFDLFGIEYDDGRLANRRAARELIGHIEDVCSVDFLWALREAIAAAIQEHNIKCGTRHPIDRPRDGKE